MELYINKPALVAEIKLRISGIEVSQKAGLIKKRDADKKISLFKSVLSLIDTIKVNEVDLEEELNNWRHSHFHSRRDKEASGEYLERISQLDLAKHFFELGLKAQHSSIGIPNIDDIFEEEGIEPNSKDAKIFKECYYMALEKLKAQKGE